MIKLPFNGSLNANTIFAGIYNMIISQQVFADNIKGTYSSLVERAKVDGTLYGDTKLYYATDCLSSSEWGNDAEASNLLQLYRPEDPECQALTLDKFRQIAVTVDNYLTKQAWSTEGAFSNFNSVTLGWIRDTKKIYDSTLYNAYVGTIKATDQPIDTVTVTIGASDNAGQVIAENMANLFTEMKDVSRDYNSYEFLRSYELNDLIVVWNAKYVNKIKKIDLPTLFHNEGLMEKFDEYTLPKRYFGTVNTASGTAPATNTTVRSMIEKVYGTGSNAVHVFAGDLLPNSAAYLANETYTVNDKIICKVIHKNSIPYMSGFEVATSFFNPKSLTETHYLTFGHNTLDYLRNYPIIEIKQA